MKKNFVRVFVCICSLALLTACSINSNESSVVSEVNSPEFSTQVNSSTPSENSTVNLPTESSTKSDVQSNVSNSSKNSTVENSKISSNTAETSKEFNLSDAIKGLSVPKVNEDSIVKDYSFNLEELGLKDEDEFDFFLKHINNRIFKPGEVIDVKKELASLNLKNTKKYYHIYGNCLGEWYFSEIFKPFDLIEGNYQERDIAFTINSKHNLILKFNKNYKAKMSFYYSKDSDGLLFIRITKV